MQIRKLQITGGSTFVLSLPKDWVEGQGLRAGDGMGLMPQDEGNMLLVPHPAENPAGRKCILHVDPDENMDHFFRSLLAGYLQAFDTIEIASKGRIEAETRNRVRDLTKKLMGTEIIEESSRNLVIQDITDPTTLPMRRALRRMSLMATAMARDAIQGVQEGDQNLAKDVITRDDEVDRLYWFVLKQYNQYLRRPTLLDKAKLSREEALVYLLAARLLERVADHACRISYQVLALYETGGSATSKKAMGGLGTLASKLLDSSLQALFERDAKLANETIDATAQLRAAKEALLHAAIKEEAEVAIPLAYVAESLERIGLYGTDICEEALNLGPAVLGIHPGLGY